MTVPESAGYYQNQNNAENMGKNWKTGHKKEPKPRNWKQVDPV